jgi:hypothetical protein
MEYALLVGAGIMTGWLVKAAGEALGNRRHDRGGDHG